MAQVAVRVCTKCGEGKPLTEFHRLAHARDGIDYRCRSCKRVAAKAYRQANIDRVRAHDRERGRTDKHRERIRARDRKAAEEGRKKPRKKKPLEVRRAQRAVWLAKLRGRLVPQPCEVCGSSKRIHAHHDDYSKPLDVRWLCPLHHGMAHWMENNREQHPSQPAQDDAGQDTQGGS